MEEKLDFLVVDKPRRGVSLAVLVSLIVHALIATYIVLHYHPVGKGDTATPMVHYIELIRQNPKEFTEAPGPKVNTAPLTAPYSDANRRASIPKQTGDKPTNLPGEGGFYAPSTPSGSEAAAKAARLAEANRELAAPPPAQPAPAAQSTPEQMSSATGSDTFKYHPTQANAAGTINWNGAIREMGKIASISPGQQGLDLGHAGGEKGFAESGPLSFESQWYDWGEYAESMVSRIRVNWYNNMPQLIRTGMKGVVTIRFTIHRDGQITDVTMLSTSNVPPYDFAARKAIELSSPLNPLPKDFPNPTERVTCMFYYNMEPPTR